MTPPPAGRGAHSPGLQALRGLVDQLGRTAGGPGTPATAAAAVAGSPAAARATSATISPTTSAAASAGPGRPPGSPASAAVPPLAAANAAPAPLRALAAHGATWAQLKARQRLRQALLQVPSQAGPLHSAQVVHRALQALASAWPAHLDALLLQLDTLHWLEQASGGDLPLRSAKKKNGRPANGPAKQALHTELGPRPPPRGR